MAWVTPHTYVPEESMTALIMQAISDSLNETAPAKASAAGEMFRAVAQNSIEAFGPGDAGQIVVVDSDGVPGFGGLAFASQANGVEGTRASDVWGNLSGGAASEITLEIGSSGIAWVNMMARMWVSSAGNVGAAGVSVAGADPSGSHRLISVYETLRNTISSWQPYEGLTPGASVTFGIKFSASAGTLNVERQSIWGVAQP